MSIFNVHLFYSFCDKRIYVNPWQEKIFEEETLSFADNKANAALSAMDEYMLLKSILKKKRFHLLAHNTLRTKHCSNC